MDNTQKQLLHRIPSAILPWYRENARDLPWRQTSEPYQVWLSEVMLQQTRVEAARGYYIRFLEALPTLSHLAQVEDDRLMKLWEGLGYYNRAKNLKRAARLMIAEHGGQFPSSHQEILNLPGIGPYTAAAIASICFGLPYPAVDGNVLRVYARICAMTDCIDLPAVKKAVTQALSELYQETEPGELNQAIMELGAMVCLPNGAPRCDLCPLASFCRAKAANTQRSYPVKAAKRPRRIETKTVFILTADSDGSLAIEKREEGGLLGGLWALPNIPGELTEQEALATLKDWGINPIQLLKSSRKTHIFTHVEWQMTGYYFSCAALSPRFTWADAQARSDSVALPTAFRQFLSE